MLCLKYRVVLYREDNQSYNNGSNMDILIIQRDNNIVGRGQG